MGGVGKHDKKFGAGARFFIHLSDRFDDLRLSQLFARQIGDPFAFLYKTQSRGVLKLAGYFDDVVNRVSLNLLTSRDVR